MKKYSYIALKDQKEQVTGYIEAETQAEARLLIKEMGFLPTNIYEEKLLLNNQGYSVKSGKKIRLSLEDKIAFTSELHNLLSSSISMLDALETIEKYSPKAKIARVTRDILENIKNGASFTQSLKIYSKTFGNVYIALCNAGENSGSLPEVLDYLIVLLKKQNSLKGKFIQMSIYPVILILIMTVLYFIVGGVLFPRIISVMQIDEVPLLARSFVDSVSFIFNYWAYILVAVVGSVYGFLCICNLENLKDKFGKFCLKIPALGNCIRYFSLVHYMSVLHISYESGIPIIEALDMAEKTINIKSIKQQAQSVVKMVKNGKSITDAFELSQLIPGILMPLVATGEKTGKLGQMFRDAALGIERKLDMALEVLAKMFEPVIILIIGVFVGICGIAIFQMYIQSIAALAF